MGERLIFLGSAGDTEMVLKQHRSSAGIVLLLAGNQFHINPGPGSLVRLKAAGLNPRETIGVVVTDKSLAHANDTSAAISGMTYDGMDRHGVLLAASSVLETWALPFYRRCVEGLVPLKPGQRVGINDVNITPVEIASVDETAVGLIFQDGKRTVGYVPHTSWHEGLGKRFQCETLILSCRHPATTREEGALNTEDVAALLKEAKPKRAFLTGFGVKLQDPMAVARKLQQETKVTVSAVKDGLDASLT